ncbi:alpha/beta hydrolase [Candidatus Marithioploca araucensis]|uniref:Alpha/beta hydrolase n=1 Tax=Candidatus Marithioploca araucensis TaxID=70273 RepID=A0ABT7VPX5_9GAMM|nr:alpha/beta hydrolase [Candidatus Marithioploca araucensis]
MLSHIVAYARSLGTGIAVHLASQRPLKGLILVSPYDSIRSVAQEFYPYVPVSLLLKHHFDAMKYAPSIKIPMLALIAEKDEIISPSHSLALINAWGGHTYQHKIPNTDHNNITMGEGYWNSIIGFLEQLKTEF